MRNVLKGAAALAALVMFGSGLAYSVFSSHPIATRALIAAAPTIVIQSPIDHALYGLGDDSWVAFYCLEGQGGPGLASCDGTLPIGSTFSDTVGEFTFTVTATSKDEKTTTQSVSYSVSPLLATPSATKATPAPVKQSPPSGGGNPQPAPSSDPAPATPDPQVTPDPTPDATPPPPDPVPTPDPTPPAPSPTPPPPPPQPQTHTFDVGATLPFPTFTSVVTQVHVSWNLTYTAGSCPDFRVDLYDSSTGTMTSIYHGPSNVGNAVANVPIGTYSLMIRVGFSCQTQPDTWSGTATVTA